MDEQCARAVLGVGSDASLTEVRGAFRDLARRHHPDGGGDPQRFGELLEARALLAAAGSAGASSSNDRTRTFVRRSMWERLLHR